MRYLRAFYFNEKLSGKELGRIEFAPVTIFCGGNGSGKTTILNYIAQNIFNKYLNNNIAVAIIKLENTGLIILFLISTLNLIDFFKVINIIENVTN